MEMSSFSNRSDGNNSLEEEEIKNYNNEEEDEKNNDNNSTMLLPENFEPTFAIISATFSSFLGLCLAPAFRVRGCVLSTRSAHAYADDLSTPSS